ncbi:craniofacial development protein 1 isoform X1 [Salminus brasiliensis]|uniref:craniofacial development protein 1 isoform X1 n=1 Tax=Salminus brasiliensis TaxID=930266 RepID=UPI003B8323A4
MMNYSDYDSEDYSSNEDEDYVPSDDNLSEDDINECEKEDGLDEENQNEPGPDHVVKKKKNKSSKGLSVRKRKKGGLKLEGDDEVGAEQKEGGGKAEEEEDKSVSKPVEQDDKKQKQKADDLWASFLKDVGPRPTAQTPDSEQTTAKATLQEDSKTTIEPPQQKQKPKEPSRVTITKVFDFAGEEVLVTKEVDADSREAKTFLKMEEKVEEKQEQLTSPSQSSSSLTPGTSCCPHQIQNPDAGLQSQEGTSPSILDGNGQKPIRTKSPSSFKYGSARPAIPQNPRKTRFQAFFCPGTKVVEQASPGCPNSRVARCLQTQTEDPPLPRILGQLEYYGHLIVLCLVMSKI